MKRLFSFLIAVLIFILNCLPVFALDSFVIENFINVTFNNTIVTFINDNLENKYLYYLMFRRNGSNNYVILSSTQELSFVQNPDNLKEITVSNLSTDLAVLTSNNSFFNKGEILGSSSFVFNPGGDTNYKVLPELLIYNKDCVNSNYCSAEIYVEMTNPDDYEEDGVVIKGLSGFFSNMIQGLKDVKNSILNLPETILNGLKNLFIPDIETMKLSFIDFMDYMTTKFGVTSLIETLVNSIDGSLQNGSNLGAADVKENFVITNGETDFSLFFSIPFSLVVSDGVKNSFDGLLKGFFFILLIFYNLSELYFLIRGVRPWKDPQIAMIHNEIERDNINSYIANRKGGGWGV